MLGTAQCSGYRTRTPAVFRLPPLRPWFNDASLCQGQCIIISCDLCHLTAMDFLITHAQRLKCTSNPCVLNWIEKDPIYASMQGKTVFKKNSHTTMGVNSKIPEFWLWHWLSCFRPGLILTKNRFLRPFSETWQPSRWADHVFQHHITTRSSTKRWDWLADQCLRDYSNSSKQLKNSTLESCISNR